MSAELQQTRYDQLIRRVGGIVGPGSKVSEALSELFPVIDVENVPGELLWLGGTRIGMGAATVTAAAGETPRIQVFNPVGSNKIATVTQALFFSTVTSIARLAITSTPLTTGTGTELMRDTRRGVAQRPVCQIRSDSTVAFTDANIFTRALANTNIFIKDDNGVVVLLPGTGFEVGNEARATSLFATFFWRERDALESETLF